MYKTIIESIDLTAEEVIMKDLMDVFIAEQFFTINAATTKRLIDVSNDVQNLYPQNKEALIYVDEWCFIVEKSYRQGYQWISRSTVYSQNSNREWEIINSPIALAKAVLQWSLSRKEYKHTSVGKFINSVKESVSQLAYSMKGMNFNSLTPQSSYDWFVKGEMIASLRDRPFHPTAKAKIGFTPEEYHHFMAEFNQQTYFNWIAIQNDYVMKSSTATYQNCFSMLTPTESQIIEDELCSKGIKQDQYTIIPVHPWQLDHVISLNFIREIKNKTVIILDTQTDGFLATSSLRSFLSKKGSTKMLKLPISVTSLGAMRYLPVVKLLNGNAGEKMFRQAINCDDTLKDKVFLCEENNWWGYMPPDMGLFDDHPRHLAAQLRLYPQVLMKKDMRVIPMSSLGVVVNESHFIDEIFEQSMAKKDVIQFYSKLVTNFYEITLRLFKVGIVPEIHGQNCCLVLDKKKITGLLFRDHDSVRLYQPYLDKHGIEDPGYYIRPGYSNSLYNEPVESLMFYIQSLGTQVNLASIMEALAKAYSIPEKTFWSITKNVLQDTLKMIDLPKQDKSKLQDELFYRKEWPLKLVVRPLLEADDVPGAMPSGKGIGYNPFYELDDRGTYVTH